MENFFDSNICENIYYWEWKGEIDKVNEQIRGKRYVKSSDLFKRKKIYNYPYGTELCELYKQNRKKINRRDYGYEFMSNHNKFGKKGEDGTLIYVRYKKPIMVLKGSRTYKNKEEREKIIYEGTKDFFERVRIMESNGEFNGPGIYYV